MLIASHHIVNLLSAQFNIADMVQNNARISIHFIRALLGNLHDQGVGQILQTHFSKY